MTIADWAFVVSLLSCALSLGGFIWNIWSKFIYPKPKLHVTFSINRMFPDPGEVGPFLALSATNHGPIECTVTNAVASMYIKYKGTDYGMLNPYEGFPLRTDHTIGPFSGGLPKKLGVGEQFTVYFPYSADGFLAEHIWRIGFSDSFGRHHWASGKGVKTVNMRYEEDFGPIGPRSQYRSQEERPAAS